MRRRQFLRGSLGAAAVAVTGCGGARARPSESGPGGATQRAEDADLVADVETALRAAPGRASILDGSPTDVWRFSGRLLRGPPDVLATDGDTYLGPTLRLRRGQRLRVQLENGIDEETIVHWHGLYVSERNDGHPRYAIAPGERFVYDFEVDERAAMYWYHPHPASRTGPQVYAGLTGLLIVTDDEEQRLSLPDGDRELMMVLQDRTFDRDNQLVYEPDPMIGSLGEQVLVNGRVPRTREVGRGPHRLRILNGSNSRIYDLAWSDGSPMTVIGTDGGLLDRPLERAHVVLTPAQRVDLWVSFGGRPGEDVWLESRAFDGVGPMMGMGRGMGRMGGRAMGMRGRQARVPNGTPLRIQRFVTTGGGSLSAPPDRLAPHPGPPVNEVVNADRPRTFTASMRMRRWLLNGRLFEMNVVAPNERVRLGTVEEWEFVNTGGHMAMAHPIHLHGSQFRIVERRHGPGARQLREGLLDEGWRDTFVLMPGDRVRIRVPFTRHPGMFLYHCHNLEHEDLGMMRNYVVET